MIVHPTRPRVESSRAKAVLEWVDVGAYVFWVSFTAVVAVILFANGWKIVSKIRIPV